VRGSSGSSSAALLQSARKSRAKKSRYRAALVRALRSAVRAVLREGCRAAPRCAYVQLRPALRTRARAHAAPRRPRLPRARHPRGIAASLRACAVRRAVLLQPRFRARRARRAAARLHARRPCGNARAGA
jgi:hypothetical protein